jgi:hypothetical protein
LRRKINQNGEGKPRLIVAKFAYNNDIMKVQKPTKNPREKEYTVNEQYPEEIEKRNYATTLND